MIEVKNNFYIRICLLWSIICLSAMMGQAQEMFHRIYPAQNVDERLYLLDATQLKNGNYVAIQQNRIINSTDGKIKYHIVVSCFKPKGDVLWSYEISDSLKQVAPAHGSIVQSKNDSIYFNAGNLFGSLSVNGSLGAVFYKNVGNYSFHNNHLLNFNNTLVSIGNFVNTNGANDIVLSKLGYNNTGLWSKKHVINDPMLGDKTFTAHSIKINQDSTLLLCGVIDSLLSFVSVVDTFGNLVWSRSFSDPVLSKSIPFISDGIQLVDSSFILVGSVREFGVTNAVSDLRGLILKLDKLGQIEWSKKVQFDNVDQTKMHEIVLDKSGDILVSGTNLDVSEFINFPFIIKINGKGEIIWKNKYKADIIQTFGASMFITKDGGAALFNTANDENRLVTSFIKIDNSGISSCEKPISENILSDDSFKSDTLKWTISDFQLIDSTVLLKSNPHNFKVPVLSLAVRPFCPNEPIDWTFDASVQGATSYLWNDNSTADTLRVFKEGEYSVMVKIDEDVCYTLCDTAKLERYTKPQAQINLSLGNFCTNGKQTLSLAYNPGHPQVKTINWSTGESSVGSIEIATPGTYSVTIVDQCDETATALINVGPFPQKLTAAAITGDPSVNCIRGTISGLLTATGNAVGLGDMKYRWSTGASTAVLSLNDTDVLTFTVTVTDGCGTTVTANKVVELKGGSTDFQITKSSTGSCRDKTINLNIVASEFSPKLKYSWSTNQITANISIDKAGTYTATLTDGCMNVATKEIKIDPSEFEVKELVYAKIFFPDGTFTPGQMIDSTTLKSEDYKNAEQYNRTFGPVNLRKYCFPDITDYELHVFNRWGQEVFVSNRISDEWDGGSIQGEQAPTESYLWVAKYKIFGIDKTVKGSVTMIRR